MGRVIVIVMSVCTRHVIWDDALAASSWREVDYIKLCGHVPASSVGKPRNMVVVRMLCKPDVYVIPDD